MPRRTRMLLPRISARTTPPITAVSWATTVRAIAVIAPSRKPGDVSARKKTSGSKVIGDRRSLRQVGGGRRSIGGRLPGLLDDAEVGRVQVVLLGDRGQGSVVLQRLEGRGQRRPDVGLALAEVDP